MQITVVRHGETLENAAGIVQGQVRGTLSPTGLEQIQAVGEELADEQFDICFSSDLERCVQTAAAITQHHPSLKTMYDQRLRERSMKPWEGQRFNELPGWDWENDRLLTHKTPEGETWSDVIARVLAFLEDTHKQYPLARVLIVTHGGPIRAFTYLLDGGSWEVVGRNMVGNCEVRRWDVDRLPQVA